MNFSEAMSYLEDAEVFGSRLGLTRITRLTELLGNPQRKLKVIHVAGTNGKGSVSAFISSILQEAGYRTGLFTSPHIDRFTERILINGAEITEEDAARAISGVKTKIDLMLKEGWPQPTEFEIVTAAAFVYFNERDCDFAVMEVGLGGRLDATNVIDIPVAGVITRIGYDHTAVLGRELSQIAFEKAGIIKNGIDAATCAQPPDVLNVLRAVCRDRDAVLHIADTPVLKSSSLGGQLFDCGGYEGLKTALLGRHQLINAALAVKAAEILIAKGYEITDRAIRDGLLNTKWTGRFELVCEKPPVILDGAHNPLGAEALSKALEDYFGNKKILFIMGVLADKNHEEILEAVIPAASRFFTVTPESVRALPAERLAELIREKNTAARSFETIERAFEEALDTILENEVICCFGSLYIIGRARGFFAGGHERRG